MTPSRRRCASALLLAALAAGCENSPDPAPPAALCVDSACGSKTRLLAIPDAENIAFTPDGRLFVSGGQNVYEIQRNGSGYRALPLAAAACNFTGLAIIADVLYANCFSGSLHAARLTATPALSPIHSLTGLSAANGLASLNGALYAVNGPTTNAPKIVRLTVDASNPLRITQQSDWLVLTPLSNAPNGLQAHEGALYFSESAPPSQGRIRRVAVQPDGSAGAVTTFAELGGVPDDFSFADGELLATLFTNGVVLRFDAQGRELSRTAPMGFDAPSQARIGTAPLFSAGDLLVTEKGVIGENDSTNGNALSVFRRR